MEKLYKKVVNSETGEEIVAEFTEQEYLDYKKEQEIFSNQKAEEDAKAEADAVAKAALLDRLGITADEAKLLLG